jgi:hypothetical protein
MGMTYLLLYNFLNSDRFLGISRMLKTISEATSARQVVFQQPFRQIIDAQEFSTHRKPGMALTHLPKGQYLSMEVNGNGNNNRTFDQWKNHGWHW